MNALKFIFCPGVIALGLCIITAFWFSEKVAEPIVKGIITIVILYALSLALGFIWTETPWWWL